MPATATEVDRLPGAGITGRESRVPSPAVLVLTNRIPYPLDDGWKCRTFHVIRGLLEKGRVTLLSFHSGGAQVVEELRAALGGEIEIHTVPTPPAHTPWRLLLGFLTRTPVYVWNLRSRAFRAVLTRLIAERSFDVAVAQLTSMHPYLRLLPPGTVRVVDTHNIDSLLLRRYAGLLPGRGRRWYAAMTAGKLERHERHAFAQSDLVWVCSDEEVERVERMAPAANVRAIPNGVDTTSLAPLPETEAHPARLVFFGKLDYHPNRDAVQYFAQEILPRLRAAHPSVELCVVGTGRVPELESLADGDAAVRLLGRVEDIRPVLASAAAVVVPLRMGGGTRLKILEALSMSKAVVSTTVGAEGLDLTAGSELLLADAPADFAKAVDSLLRDPVLRQRLGAAGRAAVIGRYDWSLIGEELTASLGWRSAPTTGYTPAAPARPGEVI